MNDNAFDRLQSADRRLVVLRVLERASGNKANHYVLRRALESMGHSVSLDVTLAELAWLEEQCLVCLESVEGVAVATLTSRGEDVALGRSRIPGVKKPVPGE